MSLFIASAHAQASGQPAQGGEMFQIVFLIGLFVLFYFIAIRPQRKRQKEHAEMVAALNKGALRRYVTDFPHPLLRSRDDCILMPHIGASTAEAEENCAVMAADQLRAFLEHGNIRNSVNFPRIELERTSGSRLAITNTNLPGTLSHILTLIGDSQINVVDLLNKSREDIAYNLIDLNGSPTSSLMAQLRALDGVINVRYIAGQ